jgi:predicted AlkP superfamily pyrophosphatase or phosphodiesterase
MQIKNNNFVFVVLDALRSDHVNEEYMPFLTSLKKKSVFIEDLNVSSGFCERAEIFFGQYPRESGFVHAISPNSDIKPYAWLSNRKAKFLTFFENNKILKKVLRRLLWKYSLYLGNSMYPQRIPLNVIRNFGFTEDSVDFEEYAKGLKKGLLYRVISLGYKISWKYFTSLSSSPSLSDNQRLQEIPMQLSLNDNQFLPVYIGTPDAYGHKFGPHSNGLITKLAELDNKLKEFYFNCQKMDPSVKLCFLGDHGMETVTQIIDLRKEVETTATKYKLKEGLDYSIFVDSTSLRFWFHKKNNLIDDFISAIKKNKLLNKYGYFLNDNLCIIEKLPNLSEMAEIVWWAKKGVQIAPDYFHDEPEGKLGMHGYLKVDDISSGFVICNSKKTAPAYKKTCECHELSEILF